MKKQLVLLVAAAMLVCGGCGGSEEVGIKIFHAGSLSVPFKQLSAAFEKDNPGVKVYLEAHGSRTAARQISDLNRSCDVMGSADSAVIRNLLMPQHANYCIDFSTNEMAIMYSEKSRFADTINADNWYRILLKPEVEYGHSDPNADPCGYRTILCWQLAEKHYSPNDSSAAGLYGKLVAGMPKKNVRAKEVDLIAMLEAGELDYIFIYRSVAVQHHAKFLVLPDQVNLKSAKYSDLYSQARVKISGKKPGEWIEKRGAPMVYGITVPKQAEHPELGAKFLAFVLSKKGRQIMAANGQPAISPPGVDCYSALPQILKVFFPEDQGVKVTGK